MTLEEQERAAYIANASTAPILGALIDATQVADELQVELDDLPSESQREQDATDLAHLREFFYDCFRALGAHYPCPEFSSDYDKSIILDAIRRGEGGIE